MKRHAPSAMRNRDAIAAVLRDVLPAKGLVLEVASGSGEHVVHFARQFPGLDWQPSDPDPESLASIAAWSDESALGNVRAPLRLDAMAGDWPIARADALLCINMVHISPWEATSGLFAHAARLLPTGAPLILYGPYLRDDVETAPSNLAFDAWLKDQNTLWGLRRLELVSQVADRQGFCLVAVHDMPANNLTLVFRKF